MSDRPNFHCPLCQQQFIAGIVYLKHNCRTPLIKMWPPRCSHETTREHELELRKGK